MAILKPFVKEIKSTTHRQNHGSTRWEALIGRVVNPLGQPLDGLGEIKTDKTRPVEATAPGVMQRQSVAEPRKLA